MAVSPFVVTNKNSKPGYSEPANLLTIRTSFQPKVIRLPKIPRRHFDSLRRVDPLVPHVNITAADNFLLT